MQLLPEVVATGGALALPLCGGTARRLIAAIVAGCVSRADRGLLADALSRDAALALWAVAKAHECGVSELRTVDALADWLSPVAMDQLRLVRSTDGAEATQVKVPEPAVGLDAVERWLTLSASSFAVAKLAFEMARPRELDADRTYLLGLLHLAPQWLSAVGADGKTARAGGLPAWLSEQLAAVGSHGAGEIASPADCVRAAAKMAEFDEGGEPDPGGFHFDRQGLAAQVADLRGDWRRDELGKVLPTLVEKLRRLRDLEQDFGRTLEAEKLESLKELAYGAGHEINNPLANISARAQTLLAGERDPQRRRMLASINAQAFRAHEMIADMMLFARPPQPKPHSFDIVELAATLHGELREDAARQHTELALQAPSTPLDVVADRTQIAVALRSLCTNALEALVTGGRVEILIDAAADNRDVQITVADNGPGIPSELRPHVFDPFFSGREAGRGLGLGLSKCWRIVTMHGGAVAVGSPHGQGAVFTLTLPRESAR